MHASPNAWGRPMKLKICTCSKFIINWTIVSKITACTLDLSYEFKFMALAYHHFATKTQHWKAAWASTPQFIIIFCPSISTEMILKILRFILVQMAPWLILELKHAWDKNIGNIWNLRGTVAHHDTWWRVGFLSFEKFETKNAVVFTFFKVKEQNCYKMRSQVQTFHTRKVSC